MRALVIGSNGTIGKPVTQILKENRYEIIEVSRYTSPSLDINDSSSIDNFYTKIGKVDAIICTADEGISAYLKKVYDKETQLALQRELLSQRNLFRKGFRNLLPGGVFVVTGGILAFSTMPQTSFISLVNTCLEEFVREVALKLTEGQRIVVVHLAWVAGSVAKMGMDPSPWPNAEKIARAYLEAIQGGKNGEPVFVKEYIPNSSFKSSNNLW